MPATARRNLNLSTDTGFLKLIAIITMVIDHAGKMFFPQYPFLRIIGRIAFPIFCYCLTVGNLYTRSMPKYILRVFILALISQPIYVLSLDHVSGLMSALPFDSQPVQSAIMWYLYSLRSANILFTLTLGLMMIWSIQEKRFIATAVLTWAVWYFDGYINYGWQGIALILLFYAFCDRPLSSFVWVFGFMLWWGMGGSYRIFGIGFSSQAFAVLALPLIYLRTDTRIKINKHFFYLFYPLHLAIIYLIDKFV